jgi:hypothetical protein
LAEVRGAFMSEWKYVMTLDDGGRLVALGGKCQAKDFRAPRVFGHGGCKSGPVLLEKKRDVLIRDIDELLEELS